MTQKTNTTPALLNHFFWLLLMFSPIQNLVSQDFITPENYFGFQPGTDNELFDYEQLIGYLQMLDQQSDRLEMRQIGQSPFGKPMFVAFISSPTNISKLDELAEINRQLALNPDLTQEQQVQYVKDGKVFFLATLSMHSNEVGPSQSAPLIAFDLVTTQNPEKLDWLQNVVYMMVPCHNPDGMDMIVNHHRKYKGTKYDDSSMPGVYHKYVGHDNNRDFVILSQSDTRAISDLTSKSWFPQVMVQKHQMGSGGVRYFVPPNHDPIAENVDAGLWNWNGVFGQNMIRELTSAGCQGVAQQYVFDNYWPGSTETCIWKNVISMLTEAASCNYAKPIYVEPTELRGNTKGLPDYKKSTNMPEPWPGGWWRLSDIVKLETVSTNSIIKTCSDNRTDILKFRNNICKKEVDKGKTEAPFYYILPAEQHDRSEWIDLARLLTDHGVKVYKLTSDLTINHQIYQAGAFVIPLSQPFRPFIKEMMEVQEYPVRRYTQDGEIIKPYDITSWSLPLHKGVKCVEIKTLQPQLDGMLAEWNITQEPNIEIPELSSKAIFSVTENDAFRVTFAALSSGLKVGRTIGNVEVNGRIFEKGSFVINLASKNDISTLNRFLEQTHIFPDFVENEQEIKTEEITMPRIALMETWFHDMDAGWTRCLFDNYGINYRVLHPGDIEFVDLSKDIDVLIFPDEAKDLLMTGKNKRFDGTYSTSNYPPEFTKGIGDKGLEKILKFVDEGGKVISWGESTELFVGPLKITHAENIIEEFTLPVSDISKTLITKGFYCPGSLMKVNLKTDHPLTWGMEPETGVFYRGIPVFSTREPNFDTDRRVIASFPEKDILISGYAEMEEQAGLKAAMVWVQKGKGQLVLFAFNPQFRNSMPATYKLLFNAILLPSNTSKSL